MIQATSTRRHLLGATLLAALAAPALAQVGDKTVRFILPNATGSGVDAITRAAQPALAKALGAAVIVDNQPGAGGIVGLQALARSAPDGFTLSRGVEQRGDLPERLQDAAVRHAGRLHADRHRRRHADRAGGQPDKVPAKDSKEFVALLKAKPDELTYASGGNGTILHLAAAMYVDEAGAKARHIPYKGVGPMVTDLIGGQVDFATAALPSVQQHIKSGALRAIGVGGAAAHAGGARDPDHRRAGPAGLRGRGLVRACSAPRA